MAKKTIIVNIVADNKYCGEIYNSQACQFNELSTCELFDEMLEYVNNDEDGEDIDRCKRCKICLAAELNL